ncbi:MAG: hypothetical protein JXA06_07725 [Bacteroidetes bacterium]|nr:hypothetical protein [Bacteroidota bacterium]
MSVQDLPIRTTIFFFMFLLFSTGDIFLTIFDASCEESKKYLPYPVEYYYLILYKNLAVILVTAIYLVLLSSVIIYVFNQPLNTIITYSAYYFSIVFPFITVGNLLSSGIPKINSNNYTILRMVLSSITVSVLSVPFGIIMLFLDNAYIVLIYSLFAALIWYYLSIPLTAKMLSNNYYKLVEII